MIRLRELRERHGYTVKEMCAKLSVDDAYRERPYDEGWTWLDGTDRDATGA